MTGNKWAEWEKTVLEPLLYPAEKGEALKRLLAQAQEKVNLALLSADVDHTQAYVFESERLPEIRGASMLLTELNEDEPKLPDDNVRSIFEKHGLSQECIVYARGGSLLAIVPHSVADTLQEEIEALYPKRTGAATITCVWQKVSPGEVIGGYKAEDSDYEKLLALRERLSDQEWQRLADYYHSSNQGSEITEEEFRGRRNFGQMRRLLEVRLRQKKQSKTTVPFHQALPFAYHCSSCQMRPATRIIDLHGEPWPVCPVCEIKQEDRREKKGRWLKEFEAFLEERGGERYYGQLSPDQVYIDIPDDLEEIGQTRLTKPGYVGFIYADGDGVGSFVGGQSSVSALKANSERIRRTIREAVYRALAESVHPERVERRDRKGQVVSEPVIHPFEIITIGGDDVLLIVPGHVAVPLAVRICQLFQEGASESETTTEVVTTNLTMSAGVVIADDHNPLRFLRDLADQLLKNAKKRARQEKEQENVTGALDFLVLRSQSMIRRDLKQLRRSRPYYYCVEDEEGEGLQLTACPYTLDEARTMLRLLIGFRRVDFPKSQLHALTAALQEGRHLSSLFYLYQQIRLGDKGFVLGHLGEIWGESWGPNPRLDLVPWQKVDQKTFRTPLPDLAELYDFVSALSADELEETWGAILEE